MMVIEAQEGQVLNWTMLVRDADQDQFSWYFSQLPMRRKYDDSVFR